MEGKLKVEIISPEKIIFSNQATMITLPSYEGDMSILENHISMVAFLRPGIIKAQISQDTEENFFVENGTVEFSNNNLVILSTSATRIQDLNKNYIENLHKDTEEKLQLKNLTDEDRYKLNHKLDVIKRLPL